jgi:hypothetical protein
LLGFEDILGIKINFHKCELVPLNLSNKLGDHLAKQLGCKIFYLPLMYLGWTLKILIPKIENKLQG